MKWSTESSQYFYLVLKLESVGAQRMATVRNPFKTLPCETRARTHNRRISSFYSCQFKDGKRSPNRTLSVWRKSFSCWEIGAINGRDGDYLSLWDEKPYLVLPGGGRTHLDEQDVVAFLDPPKELIPLDPASYKPAAYLWKKIGDIPEERRQRLLYLLKPRLISRLWEIAGTQYDDSKLVMQSASNLLSDGDNIMQLQFWNCRTSREPVPVTWINFFKKEGVWVNSSEYKTANPDPLGDFPENIVKDTNTNHMEDFERICNIFMDPGFQVTNMKLIWVDRLGFDVHLYAPEKKIFEAAFHSLGKSQTRRV